MKLKPQNAHAADSARPVPEECDRSRVPEAVIVPPSHDYKFQLSRSDNAGDKDEALWRCEFPDVPGCVGLGNSPNEAVENANRDLAAWLTYAAVNNLPVSKPGESVGFSGQLRLRVGYGTHRNLAHLAQIAGASLNETVAILLIETLRTMTANLRGFANLEELTCNGAFVQPDPHRYGYLAEPSSPEPAVCSGDLNLRIPKRLHFYISHYADQQGVSMNHFANGLISFALGRRLGLYDAATSAKDAHASDAVVPDGELHSTRVERDLNGKRPSGVVARSRKRRDAVASKKPQRAPVSSAH